MSIHRAVFISVFACLICGPLGAQAPTVGNCTVLPADNIWNTPIDQLPVSPASSTWVNTISPASPLHPDFGAAYWEGIPFITVPGNQTRYPATFTYADESDPGPYAVPLTAPLEGDGSGDSHAIAIDTDNCILYELFGASPQSASWLAGSGGIYDLTSDALRPAGWTSADAAGLPIFPGLVRYDEIAAGAIHHALRFTVPQTQNTYLWPARHFASSLTGSQYPPMGARFRLKADFDISGFSLTNQIILQALKKYGMMVADNGSPWFLSGATDSRWDDSDLHNLTTLSGANFEAVDVSPLMVNADSGQALQSGTAPTGWQGVTRYLSDIPPNYAINGWGNAQVNKSTNGNPLTIAGVQYQHGLGVHAYSELHWPMYGNCTSFTASVGIDGEVPAGIGNVDFQVWADGHLLYDSGYLTGGSPAASVNVNLTGYQTLGLVVTNGIYMAPTWTTYDDHSDWVNPTIICWN